MPFSGKEVKYLGKLRRLSLPEERENFTRNRDVKIYKGQENCRGETSVFVRLFGG